MKRIDRDSIADVEFLLRWESAEGEHEDGSLLRVNFWRDMFPEDILEGLMGSRAGESRIFRLSGREALGPYDPARKTEFKRSQFDEKRAIPRYGRFYPKGILRDCYNVFPQNREPVRCAGVDEEKLLVDCNHPMAGRDILLTAAVHDVLEKPFDRGGQSRALLEAAADGPGMQVRYNEKHTDFLYPGALSRTDEKPDSAFYEKPRLVTHIDDRAAGGISAIYGRFLGQDMSVLDLMSSWRSHVPKDAQPEKLVGLGMNAQEMEDNPQLTDHVIHDLNENPELPFADAAFDRVICTVSVEYLTRPLEVFREVGRVLKPEGVFVQTFSNRWFPPKAIRLWSELHEFERVGLVLQYFERSLMFTGLGTSSLRGRDRPETDRYYPQMPVSDPVYAVWGTKIGGRN